MVLEASNPDHPAALRGPITLRRAERSDAAAILTMLKALAAYQGHDDHFNATVADIERDGFCKPAKFEAFLAECEGEAVGLAVIHHTYSTWQGGAGIFVQDLFVDERMRGRGVGNLLLERVAAVAEERGCNHLQLNVVHANPARGFYHRLGFHHIDDLLTYRLDGPHFEALAQTGKDQA